MAQSSYKLNIIVRHGLQTRASSHCYSCSYRVIVTAQERTGRDLSLQNYNHEKSDATIASLLTIASTIEIMSVFGLSAFDLLRCRRQSDAGG
ncbi:MAG TPA: hypothetical protein VIG72_05280 [Pontibacter sp.]